MKQLADLHTHSNFSDGLYSPIELIRLAERIGLGGLALTDHDTIDGLSEFLKVETKIMRVPGIEISTEHEGNEVHILGYFVPMDSAELNQQLKELQLAREKRFPKMVEKMRSLGYEIPDESIQEILKGVTSPGRPHLARVLTELGITSSIDDAFMRFLATGRPAYVKKAKMRSIDAVRLLKQVGAVPVLAHPLLIKNIDLREFVSALVDSGLMGVETHYAYPFYPTEEDHKRLSTAIKGLDLIETGGTDFHGDDHEVQLGDVAVSLSTIEELRDASR